jgi:hypothetical protein
MASLGYAVMCFMFARWQTNDSSLWGLLFPFWPVISWETTLWTYGLAIGLPLAILALVGVIAVSVLDVAAVVTAISSIFVAPEMILGGTMFDVSVEAAPPGQCDFVQLPPPESDGVTRMQHGTHSNPEAIRQVAAWLKGHF